MKLHIVVPLFIVLVHFLFTLLALVRKKRFKNAIKKEAYDYTPSLNVFVPCKGWDKERIVSRKPLVFALSGGDIHEDNRS